MCFYIYLAGKSGGNFVKNWVWFCEIITNASLLLRERHHNSRLFYEIGKRDSVSNTDVIDL